MVKSAYLTILSLDESQEAHISYKVVLTRLLSLLWMDIERESISLSLCRLCRHIEIQWSLVKSKRIFLYSIDDYIS